MNLAEFHTEQAHPDYGQVKQEFLGLLQAGDPVAIAIAQQMYAHPSPPAFVYEQAKRLKEFRALQDPVSFREQIAREERAKVIAEMQAQGRTVPAVPQSLNSVPSAPASSTPSEFEPTPLERIVKFNF
jgi:hypothetical protein